MPRIPKLPDPLGLLDRERTLEQRKQAATNLFDHLFRGGIADRRRMDAEVIDDGPKRTLYRYEETAPRDPQRLPVLLVPPLAAQATCFDLRRGCSMTEHLLSEGRPTYLVDYGPIAFSDKELGLEHWINEVLPLSIEKVSADNDGAPVQVVGWCLGGLMGLVTAAAHPELPVNALAMVASPVDSSKLPLSSGLRRVANVTGGGIVGGAIRALGGAPAKLNEIAFKASSLQAYVKKPLTVLRRRDDREFLAHIEAVDGLMDNMYAYPGRTMGQLYHRFFLANELHSGTVIGKDRVIALADVRVPVMNVAGAADVLAPVASAHALGDGILPNAPEVRLEVAPGGHLGVLTGRSARDTTWRMITEFFAAHAPAAAASA